MNDVDIIEKVITVNKDLYSLIIDKYHNELFKFAYNIVGNYETTEDLLQEIFLKLYKNLKKYNSEKASFRTWMYRVANNHILSYLKSKDNRNNGHIEYDDAFQKGNTDIEKEIEKEEEINLILKIMNSILKPKALKIMMLHYFSELSVKEISESTMIPEKTIYKSIKSSLDKIKKEVAQDE